MRFLIAKRLQKEGYLVAEAEDGLNAYNVAAAGPCDFSLFIINRVMPGGDGYQGVDLIKRLRVGVSPKTPILTLGGSDRAGIDAAMAAGANGWIIKPFDLQKLSEVVRKAIG